MTRSISRRVACAGSLLTMLCTPAFALTAPDAGYNDLNTRFGDYLQFGLPALGLGLTFLLKSGSHRSSAAAPAFADGESELLAWNRMSGSPLHDFGLAFGRMEVVTYGLKYSVPEERPNGGAHSFPSGHTAAAFMGAEFIRKEYGWGWGTPSLLAASYVGWTRQQSRNHYTRDVLAGALVGVLSNHDLSELDTPIGHVDLGVSMVAAGSRLYAVDDASPPIGETLNPRDVPTRVPVLSVRLEF